MAMPDVAALVTVDSPPKATESAANALAPRTALAPMATEPAPLAIVRIAGVRDVVDPIAVELVPDACAPLPIAVAKVSDALAPCPNAKVAPAVA